MSATQRRTARGYALRTRARFVGILGALVFGAAFFALAAALAISATRGADVRQERAQLRFEPRFVLETVAQEMHVRLSPEIALPEILLESTTSLERFQNAIEDQWGFRPHTFTNAYAAARNEIYLTDNPQYYRLGRTLDDALAHELAHFIQSKYLNADPADVSLEDHAIAVQESFRRRHLAHAS